MLLFDHVKCSLYIGNEFVIDLLKLGFTVVLWKLLLTISPVLIYNVIDCGPLEICEGRMLASLQNYRLWSFGNM